PWFEVLTRSLQSPFWSAVIWYFLLSHEVVISIVFPAVAVPHIHGVACRCKTMLLLKIDGNETFAFILEKLVMDRMRQNHTIFSVFIAGYLFVIIKLTI